MRTAAALAIGALVSTAVPAFAPSAVAAPAPPALEAGQAIADRYIVVLRDGVGAAGFATSRGLRPDAVYGAAVNGFAVNMSARAAAALRRNPNVLHVEQDRVMSVTAPPTGIDRIDVDENLTAALDGNPATGAADIDIAVLDTGVDTNHPDLNVAGGAGYAGFALFGIFWVCDDGTASFEDGHGHGTHVSGTIAALDDGPNSGPTDVAGVVPGARIHGVKVLSNSGSGAISCIIDGVDWVTQQKLDYQNSGGASGVDFAVANMSLGGGSSAALCTAVNNSVAAGIVYAVAAGNEAQDASTSSPANCSSALTVSAIADFDGQPGGLDHQTVVFSSCTETTDDSTACFTNDGATVEVAAPGVNILSTVPGGGYGTSSGTSMASPHVAGAVALYRLAGNAIGNASGPAVISQMTASGWTVPQASACGFTGDTDGFAEPMIYVGSSCTGGAPDVTNVAVTDVSAPAIVELGDTVAVTVTVANEGNQDVTGVDVSLTATGGGAISDSPQTVDLLAGQVTVLSFSWNTTGTAAGVQTLTASHDLADDDPSDDSASTTSSVEVAVTDVAITDVSAPASVTQGSSVPVSVTVENEGNQDVTGVGVALTTTGGSIIGSPQSVDLLAGQAVIVNFTWNTTGSSLGVQTLTASHDLADDDASDDSASTSSTVDAPSADIHVGDLDASSSSQGRTWTAVVTIRIVDGSGSGVSGATVSGTWGSPVNSGGVCTTGVTGTCTVSASGIRKNTKSVSWTVTNVSHSSSYDPGSNTDPDGDSNGTTITVNRA